MDIGSVIYKARTDKNISQKELAQQLSLMGINVSNQAVSKWEKGTTEPSASQFAAVCVVLDIEDAVGELYDGRYGVFAGLNREGRQKLVEHHRILVASSLYSIDPEITEPRRKLPCYDISVSAGTGQYLDGENYEMIEVGDEVPADANFAVRIAGDSMEPRFHDGEIVFVKQQPALMSGQFGIFLYDGNAYLKQLMPGKKNMVLHSLNPDYDDIVISPMLPLRVLGRVVG